jgi:hypothetical protein
VCDINNEANCLQKVSIHFAFYFWPCFNHVYIESKACASGIDEELIYGTKREQIALRK